MATINNFNSVIQNRVVDTKNGSNHVFDDSKTIVGLDDRAKQKMDRMKEKFKNFSEQKSKSSSQHIHVQTVNLKSGVTISNFGVSVGTQIINKK